MKIIIETIPHDQQRYPTCGDWFTDTDGTLHIKVSKLSDEKLEQLIAVHELLEVLICRKRGITAEQVDWFDKGYEAARKTISPDDNTEPGDSPNAPYAKEHAFATEIEKRLSVELGVDWSEYEKEINALP